MARRELVGDIHQPSNYGRGDEDIPECICCVDGQQPEIHEVWTFGEGGVAPEVHPTARIDIGAFVGEFVAAD